VVLAHRERTLDDAQALAATVEAMAIAQAGS
jgi:hypothetical protein